MFQGTTVTGTLVIVSRVTVGIIISIGRQIEYCFKWKELLNVSVQSNRAALVHEMQHFHLQINICIQTYQILLKDKTMTNIHPLGSILDSTTVTITYFSMFLY